jgi:WD40 repeat protein
MPIIFIILASAPNSIIITQVNLKESGARITNRLRHELYNANSWLIKPATSASNEYLAAPTITGRILIFNIEMGQLTASFHTHDDSEVRQVLFHPQLPIMVSCGDDGRIRIYYQK